jgi:hypothetical protein
MNEIKAALTRRLALERAYLNVLIDQKNYARVTFQDAVVGVLEMSLDYIERGVPREYYDSILEVCCWHISNALDEGLLDDVSEYAGVAAGMRIVQHIAETK